MRVPAGASAFPRDYREAPFLVTADGGAKFRGAVYFQTFAPSLMSINGNCMDCEWNVDAQGKATCDIWE